MLKLYHHQFHKHAGASFSGVNGFSIPVNYGRIEEELAAVNQHVALFDRSYLGKLALSGSDALDILHRISTNDLQYLAVDTMADTVFVTPKGRLIDFCRVINLREEIVLISSFFYIKHLFDWINRFIILEDVTVRDASADYAWLTVIGPHVRQFLGKIASRPFTEKDETIWIQFAGKEFPILKNINFKVPAYNFCFRNKDSDTVMKSLIDYLNVFEGRLIGDTAFQIIRVESGMPDGNSEITQDYNPHEARLTPAISFTKGCYTGQEVIARLDTYDKVQKYLMILELVQEISQKPPLEVYIDEENIGHLTSYIYNPVSKKSVGLAYLKKMYTMENDLYMEVQAAEARIPARSRIPPQAYL
jgi:folate-binding protein YgfZ